MTDDRDRTLQALFSDAEQTLEDEAFTAGVMAKATVLRRRAILRRAVVLAAIVFVGLLLASPVQTAVAMLAGLLTHPLVGIDNSTVAQVVLPVNTIAFPLALGLLALRAFRRRLFA